MPDRTSPMRLALALVVMVAAVAPAGAADKPPIELYQAWLIANEDCRGGSPDDAKTVTACDYRNVIDDKMKAAGWCYGLEGRGGPTLDWRHCRR